jgi:hypothetical protein
MSPNDDYSPDEDLGAETFEQGDEAQDERTRIDPEFTEDLEQDPSLNPTLQVDDRELDEAGVTLDDPERLATLDGGMDDPDGIGSGANGSRPPRESDEGWDLDAPVAPPGDDDEDELPG